MEALDYRYGLFLRPSPGLCRRLAEAHLLLKQQYGFVAAAVFPPHMTIVGHLATTHGSDDVIEAYDALMASYSPIRVVNSGIKRWGKGIAYDVDQLEDGTRNPAIVDLFERSFAAVEPIRTIVGTDHLGERRRPMVREHTVRWLRRTSESDRICGKRSSSTSMRWASTPAANSSQTP